MNINNTYETEEITDSMASKKAIELIKGLSETELRALFLDFYSESERKLRSLAFKQLQDSIKRMRK